MAKIAENDFRSPSERYLSLPYTDVPVSFERYRMPAWIIVLSCVPLVGLLIAAFATAAVHLANKRRRQAERRRMLQSEGAIVARTMPTRAAQPAEPSPESAQFYAESTSVPEPELAVPRR
jgi:hypothetical protein